MSLTNQQILLGVKDALDGVLEGIKELILRGQVATGSAPAERQEHRWAWKQKPENRYVGRYECEVCGQEQSKQVRTACPGPGVAIGMSQSDPKPGDRRTTDGVEYEWRGKTFGWVLVPLDRQSAPDAVAERKRLKDRLRDLGVIHELRPHPEENCVDSDCPLHPTVTVSESDVCGRGDHHQCLDPAKCPCACHDAEPDTWECDECGRRVDRLYGSCDVCYPEKKNEQRCPKCHNREPAVLSCDCEDGFIDVGVVAGQRATARPEDAPHPVVGGGASAPLAAAGHDVAADPSTSLADALEDMARGPAYTVRSHILREAAKLLRDHETCVLLSAPSAPAEQDFRLNTLLHRFWGLEPCETACTCIIKSGSRVGDFSILGLANALQRATLMASRSAGSQDADEDRPSFGSDGTMHKPCPECGKPARISGCEACGWSLRSEAEEAH